jgi:hypothetical protein
VGSAVYKVASQPHCPEWSAHEQHQAETFWKQSRAVDPENRLLARRPRTRLEGEAIRDAMLVASDRLSDLREGPGVRPPLPAEVTATLLANQWKVSPNPEDHRRRSIYLFVRRNLRYPLFEAFDRPDTNASCPRRNRSTIAPQALILLNSEFSLAAAKELAGNLFKDNGSDSQVLVQRAFRQTLGRSPSTEELALGMQFMDQQAQGLKESGRSESDLALPADRPEGVEIYKAAAVVDFCLAMFNLNEFVYLD